MNILDIKEHENVMLIAMSTLPGRPQFNTYKIQEGDKKWIFKGIPNRCSAHKCGLCVYFDKLDKESNKLSRQINRLTIRDVVL